MLAGARVLATDCSAHAVAFAAVDAEQNDVDNAVWIPDRSAR